MAQSRSLRGVSTLEEFRAYVQRIRPTEFLRYEQMSEQKRIEIASLLGHIGFDAMGTHALDLGPGFGDSLDLLRERGAAVCSFVELDPVFYTYNRLKGFEGEHFNFVRKIKPVYGAPFDFVLVSHSISYTSFRFTGARGFRRWLGRLRMIVKSTGVIVLCPWWPSGPHPPSREQLASHWLVRTAIVSGFELLPWIEGHNKEVIYPVTLLGRGQT